MYASILAEWNLTDTFRGAGYRSWWPTGWVTAGPWLNRRNRMQGCTLTARSTRVSRRKLAIIARNVAFTVLVPFILRHWQ